jgi:hypothetical protein
MLNRWLIVAVMTTASSVSARTMASETATERVEPAPVPARPFASILVDSPDDPRTQIEQSALDVREVGSTAIVTLALTVASTAETWQVARLSVGVPHDAKVVGMTIDTGNGPQLAESQIAVIARHDFEESARISIDPALLEWSYRAADYERFRLSVYPVSNETRATAIVTITMPRVGRLLAIVAGQRHEHRAGMPSEGTKQELAMLASESMIDETHALYAAPPIEQAPSRTAIRNTLRATRGSFRMCNLFHDTDRGTTSHVVLHFTIASDGHVYAQKTEGASADLDQCFSDVIGSLRFQPSVDGVEVNYPVRFTTASESQLADR